MPNFDRTGPQGRGAMTGRQLGHCGDGTNGNHFGRGRGNRGRGYGFGNGFGRHQNNLFADVSEKTLVQNQINVLKDQLSSLEKRMQELD
ncbi:MAG: DUF5320 domain-containing protein [Chlorobi bacterium]|nr:DUF5320 domain-containing protein [Chlorobiota bacterium]